MKRKEFEIKIGRVTLSIPAEVIEKMVKEYIKGELFPERPITRKPRIKKKLRKVKRLVRKRLERGVLLSKLKEALKGETEISFLGLLKKARIRSTGKAYRNIRRVAKELNFRIEERKQRPRFWLVKEKKVFEPKEIESIAKVLLSNIDNEISLSELRKKIGYRQGGKSDKAVKKAAEIQGFRIEKRGRKVWFVRKRKKKGKILFEGFPYSFSA